MQQIVFCGLDNAGKTTLRKLIKEGDFISETKRTVAFELDQISFFKEEIRIVDLGGQQTFRINWGQYLRFAKAVIWVLDASDKNRYDEAYIEFKKMLEMIKDDAIILILANKSDKENIPSSGFFIDMFQLKSLKNKYNFFKTSTKTTLGLRDALTWLYVNLTGNEIKFNQEEYRVPPHHLLDESFQCIYFSNNLCPYPNERPEACKTCEYQSCYNCINQGNDCINLFSKSI